MNNLRNIPRAAAQQVLLIGDADQQMYAAVRLALPAAHVHCTPDYFQAIAELSTASYSLVLASADPIERRAQAAITAMRQVSGDSRIFLFSHPTLEPLSQRMLQFGCDDYLISPVAPGEITQALEAARLRIRPTPPPPQEETQDEIATTDESAPLESHENAPFSPSLDSPAFGSETQARRGEDRSEGRRSEPGGISAEHDESELNSRFATDPSVPSNASPAPSDETAPTTHLAASILSNLNVANIILETLLKSPADLIAAVCAQINQSLPAAYHLSVAPADSPPPDAAISQPIPQSAPSAQGKILHWVNPQDADRDAMSPLLANLAAAFAKAQAIQDRYASIQRLAITDDLTGLHNARYFRHFLNKIIEKAREMRFPVTLFVFDIDNFKQYNDQFGHTIGDQIIRQTAALMRRCVREHDLVARMGGDEFAVVFWENHPPRQPRDPQAVVGNRGNLEVGLMLDRFRKLLTTEGFAGLGLTGKGSLTISGGLAVYPYDARDAAGLLEAADQQLVFGAKRSGKNTIHLVGENPNPDSPNI